MRIRIHTGHTRLLIDGQEILHVTPTGVLFTPESLQQSKEFYKQFTELLASISRNVDKVEEFEGDKNDFD